MIRRLMIRRWSLLTLLLGGGDKSPADGHCDAASTLDPQTDIGFPASCPGTPIPGPVVDCGDLPADTLDELVGCVDCMTSATADCADRGAVPALAPYPRECGP
jgi:hypothetical protein